MAPHIVAIAGPLRGQTVSLTGEALTIGREPSNHLHPPDLSLSRTHSVLTLNDDRVTLTDLDSVNGTFVNGVPIKSRVLEHWRPDQGRRIRVPVCGARDRGF